MEKINELKMFLLEHKIWLIVGVIILFILGIGIYFIYPTINHEKEDENLLSSISKELESDDEQEESCQAMVDIKGEIKTPGLYHLECNNRVQDVIDLAGGLTTKADTSVLNLGKKITDEMVIIIYSKEQVANFTTTKEEENIKQEACQNNLNVENNACITSDDVVEPNIINTDSSSSTVIGDTPVNNTISLNTATKEELMTLSGIGESKAESIILYREEHGGFKTIEEIKNIKGIGDSIFEKIKANITI
jgi:competence protein ComEA